MSTYGRGSNLAKVVTIKPLDVSSTARPVSWPLGIDDVCASRVRS